MTVIPEQRPFEAMTAEPLAIAALRQRDSLGRAVCGLDAPRIPQDHGEVFTKRWIVDLILDLIGYTPDRDLAALVAVEPACGRGAFLIPMIERLVDSCVVHGRPITDAATAIRAFDVLGANATAARKAVAGLLRGTGLTAIESRSLAERWVNKGDFLLHPHDDAGANFVIGNPPYIRLENLPRERNAVYRHAFPTMRGRSDIFVGFIECGLRQLRAGGVLGFIVADRWMRNQYGSGLRSLISDRYSVDAVLQLHDVDAFENRVAAYPAITVISNKPQDRVIVADTTERFDGATASQLVQWARARRSARFKRPGVEANRTPSWFVGSDSWPSGSAEQLALLADIEARFPLIEESAPHTRVGIGVATGADAVYLSNDPDVVERDRLLPLVMARDITEGTVRWSGTRLVNPWDDGRLVDLLSYPRLAAYLEAHSERVRSRHVAARARDGWYRTIDRVEPGLLEEPKLLLPDMKSTIHPVLDEGRFYPHHNLYFVTSIGWDLRVLGGLLLSDIANLFVGAYCVKMRGGCFRFQAQYLRRIRVPRAAAIPKGERRALAAAFDARDVVAANKVAARVYGI